jgi:hypothetical protein
MSAVDGSGSTLGLPSRAGPFGLAGLFLDKLLAKKHLTQLPQNRAANEYSMNSSPPQDLDWIPPVLCFLQMRRLLQIRH